MPVSRGHLVAQSPLLHAPGVPKHSLFLSFTVPFMNGVQTSLGPAAPSSLERTGSVQEAGGWQRFQEFAEQHSANLTVNGTLRMDLTRLGTRLNVSQEELRAALFESMEVVAVVQSEYIACGKSASDESAPLLGFKGFHHSSRASLASSSNSVTMTTQCKPKGEGSSHRRGCMMLMPNLPDPDNYPASDLGMTSGLVAMLGAAVGRRHMRRTWQTCGVGVCVGGGGGVIVWHNCGGGGASFNWMGVRPSLTEREKVLRNQGKNKCGQIGA